MDSTHSSLHHFRRNMEPPTLDQSPNYPSPARSDSEATKYSTEGLGVYNYSVSLPSGGLPTTSTLYPPSPQPTEVWNPQLSNSPSSLMPEVSTDSWASLYDSATSRSPLSWHQPSFSYPPSSLVDPSHSPGMAAHHYSHRSSVSSLNDASMYSRCCSESVYTPNIKLETPQDWLNDEEDSAHNVIRQQPLTVSPDRLCNSTLPYRYDYSSPTLQAYEPASTAEPAGMDLRSSRSAPPERRRNSGRRYFVAGQSQRMRIRRNPTTHQNANYSCEICNKLFQRSYNYKAHMETHNPMRSKPCKCPYSGCDKSFVRKTDLTRHEHSVHLRNKNYKCGACDAVFARRDTLRRHEEDGCPRRFEVRQAHQRRFPVRTAVSRSAGSPDAASPRQAHAESRSPAMAPSEQTPLFNSEAFARL